MLWLWANRDLAKCLLAMALILMGWLAAVNTANDDVGRRKSELFGTVEGAKVIVGVDLAGTGRRCDRGRAHGLGVASRSLEAPLHVSGLRHPGPLTST